MQRIEVHRKDFREGSAARRWKREGVQRGVGARQVTGAPAKPPSPREHLSDEEASQFSLDAPAPFVWYALVLGLV